MTDVTTNDADETGEAGERFKTQCKCIRWHAPKPTQDYDVLDVKVCPVTYLAVQALVGGASGPGFSRFQKDLAARVSESGASLPDPA